MRLAACTVVAALAMALDAWAQALPPTSQRAFGLSHRPDPRGNHGFGGDSGSGSIGSGTSPGFGGATTLGGWSPPASGGSPFAGASLGVPSMYLDLPALPGIPSIRDRRRELIPDCIRR